MSVRQAPDEISICKPQKELGFYLKNDRRVFSRRVLCSDLYAFNDKEYSYSHSLSKLRGIKNNYFIMLYTQQLSTFK